MFKKSHRLISIIVASSFVALSSGCSLEVDLSTYKSQEVTWGACDESLLDEDIHSAVFKSSTVECSSMLVPAQYSGFDNGVDFKIQMMRLHKAKPEDFKGSIFINPGGPGGSGLEQLQYSDFPENLVAHYDIIGFDPRGVGASDFSDGSEIKCSDTIDYQSYFEGEGSPANLDEVMENLPASDNYFQDCTKNNPLWWTLSTDHVVDDLELMRQVVTGDENLNFIGSSYGTTIAGMYVTKYPEHVEKSF